MYSRRVDRSTLYQDQMYVYYIVLIHVSVDKRIVLWYLESPTVFIYHDKFVESKNEGIDFASYLNTLYFWALTASILDLKPLAERKVINLQDGRNSGGLSII